MRGARTLNSVSRSLSDVGRPPSQVGESRRRPFRVPAITRIESDYLVMRRFGDISPDRSPSHQFAELTDSLDLYQPESLLPALEHLRQRLSRRRGGFEPRVRFDFRAIEDRAIANEIDRSERRHARLARAEEVAWPAQREIALRNFEAVGRLRHRAQALTGLVGERRLIHQETVRLVCGASHASPQLMEL